MKRICGECTLPAPYCKSTRPHIDPDEYPMRAVRHSESSAVSRKLSRVRRVAVRTLAAIVMTSPGFGSAQPAFDRPATDTQRRIIDRIREIETQDSPNSAALIDPLTTLGILYFESRNHLLATVANQRALEIVRITHGLHSLEQAAQIRQLIANYEAIGQHSTAWDLEQDLLALAERHPEDLRSVSIYQETADKRIEIRERYLAGEFPPQIVLGCYYGWPRTSVQHMAETPLDRTQCSTGSSGHAVQTLTVDAQRYYAEAIAVIHRTQRYSSPVLRELEMGLVRCSDFLRDYDEAHRTRLASLSDVDEFSLRRKPWRSWTEAMTRAAGWNLLAREQPAEPGRSWHPEHYGIARDSLERLFAYDARTTGSWETQANTLLQIFDWDLLHSKNTLAIRGYAHVHQQLEQMGIEQASISRIFQPELPVVLPSFRPNPLNTEQTSQSGGFIDVEFEITRYGVSRHVEILDTTTNASAREIADLVDLIRRSRFRPEIDEKGLARKSRALVRYYLTQ
jgi:hypothetical protein